MTIANNHWDRVIGEVNLVSLPDIYWQLKQIIDSNDYAIGEIADLLGLDPGMTARLLRIVNSAYFGFASKIASVNHAVSILGTQQIHDLVLATSIADSLGGFECEQLDVRRFWQRSVYRAIIAKNLANHCNLLDAERLFVAGLLSGVGHLIMYQVLPKLCMQAQIRAQENDLSLYLAEQQVFKYDHAMVAAELMRNWNLPDSLVEVVRYHIEPEVDSAYLLEIALVHIASHLGDAIDNDRSIQSLFDAIHPSAWQRCGLDSSRCDGILVTANEQFGDVCKMLFPNKSLAEA